MTIKAYIYSRFSSTRQEHGDSTRRQHDACYAFAEELGVPIDPVMHDPALSAYTGLNRVKGALASFISKVEAGEITRGSYLLVDSIDRLSREDETTALHLFTGLSLSGVRIVSVAEKHVLPVKPDMTDWIRLIIHASRAHHESAEKSRKVAEAHGKSKRLAREQGIVWHKSGPTWLEYDEETKRHKPIAAKAAIVKRIFDDLECGFGTTKIAQIFNEERLHTPRERGAGWHHSAVLEIARNRAVIGEYQPGLGKGGRRGTRREKDGPPIPDYYPAIIEAAQFYRVQEIINGRTQKKGKGSNGKTFKNLFRDMARCAVCNTPMGYDTPPHHHTWKRSPALFCYTARRKGLTANGLVCTNTKRVRYDTLEKAFLTHVKDFALPSHKKRDDSKEKLDLARAKRIDLNNQLENLEDLIIDGNKRWLAQYQKRAEALEILDAEITALEKRVTHSQASPSPQDRRSQLLELMTKLDMAEGDDLYRLRANMATAIKGVVSVIYFDEHGHADVTILDESDQMQIRRVYRFMAGELIGSADNQARAKIPDSRLSPNPDEPMTPERLEKLRASFEEIEHLLPDSQI